eukprot:gene15082-17855_t
MDLPNEVTLRILANLDPNDIASIKLTNRRLSRLHSENPIWRAICKRKWSSSPVFKRRPLAKTYTFDKIIPKEGIPPKYARHSAVAVDHKVLTFGGFNGLNKHYELCVYDTIEETWTYQPTTGDEPIPRTNHSASVIGKHMYIYGGMYKEKTNQLIFLDDLYRLDTETYTWKKIIAGGDLPPPKCGHRLMTFENKLLLFGGGYGLQWEKKYNDVHIYDPLVNRWTKVAVKGSAPVSTFTITFSAGPFMFVFGGQSIINDSLTNDLYMLDTINMEWTKIEAQSPPFPSDMGSGNIVGSTLFMFGGYNSNAIDSLHVMKMSQSSFLMTHTRHNPIPIYWP